MLAGLARSGKDSTASFLIDNYGFKKLAFADRLKILAKNLIVSVPIYFPFTRYKLFDLRFRFWDGKEDSKRFPCIELGAKARRHITPNVWIYPVLDEIKATSQDVVISDCRYANEYKMVAEVAKELGIQLELWYIDRDVPPQGEEAENTVQLKEIADRVIDNNSSLAMLHLQIKAIMDKLYANAATK